jgi:hypothetical protein
MKFTRISLLCCILLGALLVVGAAGAPPAQDTNTRSVQGVVRGLSDEAVEGAVVKLKNSKTLQIRSYFTDEKGEYIFHGLTRDVDYELRAEWKQGDKDLASAPRNLSMFDSRRKAIVNLKLEPASK